MGGSSSSSRQSYSSTLRSGAPAGGSSVTATKTTTAVNVSAILALDYKKKVLLIDFDSQGNASISLGIKNDVINYQYLIVMVFLSIRS